MATTLQMQEVSAKNVELINGMDPELLAKPLDPDPTAGPEAVASLLTFLPPEGRKSALIGFVMAMLCD